MGIVKICNQNISLKYRHKVGYRGGNADWTGCDASAGEEWVIRKAPPNYASDLEFRSQIPLVFVS